MALHVASWFKSNRGTNPRTDDHHFLRSFQVAVKAIRLQDGGVDEKVCTLQCYDDDNDDLCSHGCATQALRRELGTWKRLQHVNILPLLGIARGFCPCISMVSPWFENGSLTLYLRKYNDITLFDRLRLVSFCMIRQRFN